MAPAWTKSPIFWGCILWVAFWSMPLIAGISKDHSSIAGGLICLALGVASSIGMLKHSRVSRALMVFLCLFLAIVMGIASSLDPSHRAGNFLFGLLFNCLPTAFFLWLAWLFGFSRSAREWFKKSDSPRGPLISRLSFIASGSPAHSPATAENLPGTAAPAPPAPAAASASPPAAP